MRPFPSPLIDAPSLHARLGDPNLVLLDASAAMPGDPHDPKAGFAAAHLPGARFFDLELFSDPETDLPHMVPTPGRFGRLAGALGIGHASEIVVYDARRPFSAPRAWWLFRLFGHGRVQVLDGGLPAWREAGFALEHGEASPAHPAMFTPRLRTDLLAGLGDVERISEAGGSTLLDARAAGRFDGTAPEPRPGIRSGHIPGSRNLPFSMLYGPDGRMKPVAELRALFAGQGVAGQESGGHAAVTVTCGTGVTAASLALGLAVAGLGEARLYDGSWTEWATVHA